MNFKSTVFNVKEQLARSLSSHVVAARTGSKQPGMVKAGTSITPIMARASNTLCLPQLRDDSARAIESLLTKAGVKSWRLATETSQATLLGIASRDANLVLAALEASANVSNWYVRMVSAPGKVLATVSKVRDGRMRTSWPGIALYDAVVHEEHHSFLSTPLQGVEIHFWDAAVERKTLISRVWNQRVTELPDPLTSNAAFAKALEKANQPLADEPNFPIDAVYTWVDGTDEAWQRAKTEVQAGSDGEALIQDALAAARFADHDELRFSLRSIEQYAPWIRKIWIVTNGQIPSWLDTGNPKVQVVTHEEIWPTAEGLPNFNSHAIEACLHRIEGLAEHYLYFNDDMILGRPVAPSRFFHGNGVSKFFYSRALVDFAEISDADNASTIAAKNARDAMARTFISTVSRKFFHTPSPLRKSVVEKLEGSYPDLFAVTRKAQFREHTDIAAAGSFYFNVAGAMGEAVPARIRYEYIDPAIEDGRQRMKRVIDSHDKDTICVNDGSTDETETERIETDRFIRSSLEEFLPVPSAFEKKSS